MRNELFIYLGRPTTWRNEINVKQNGKSILIADAVFNRDNLHHFVEVDNTQKMIKNVNKIKRYKTINGEFKLVWITRTELRRRRLEELCQGLNAQVYTIDDI